MLNKISSQDRAALNITTTRHSQSVCDQLKTLREKLRATVEYKETMAVGSIQYSTLCDQARALREQISQLVGG